LRAQTKRTGQDLLRSDPAHFHQLLLNLCYDISFSPHLHYLPRHFHAQNCKLTRPFFSFIYIRRPGSRKSQNNLYDFRIWNSRTQNCHGTHRRWGPSITSFNSSCTRTTYRSVLFPKSLVTCNTDRMTEIHERISRIRSSSTHRNHRIVHSIIPHLQKCSSASS